MNRLVAALFLPFVLLILKTNGEEECQLGAIDLVFVMDESKSVGQVNFTIGLEAAVQLTNSLTIGNGNDLTKSRVGLVLFGNYGRLGFNLTQYNTNALVSQAIKQTTYGAGGTDIANGMDFANKKVFVPALRDKSVPRIMLIITDGKDTSDVAMQHGLADENDIIIYALGVSSDVDFDELEKATGSKDRIYYVDDFTGLSGAMRNICRDIAGPTPDPDAPGPKTCDCELEKLEDNKYWLDVIFVTDTTNGVNDKDFEAMAEFLSTMTLLNVQHKAGDPQYTRMAIINTGDKATVLTNLTSDIALLNDVIKNKFKRVGKNTFVPQEGLKAAYDMIQEEETLQVRQNVRKVVVLFSTVSIDCHKQERGKSSKDADILCELVSVMQGDFTSIISVGVKLADAKEFPYIDIANPCNVLNNTETMMQDLLTALCRANCYCLEPYTQFTIGNDGCYKYGECVYAEQLSLPYHSAKATCADQNNTLSIMLSKEKDDFLTDMHLKATFFPFWIGATCTENGCTADGDTVISSDGYTNWCTAKGQPSYKTGQCVYKDQCDKFTTGWFSAKCGTFLPAHYFSCQTDSCTANHYCEYFKK